ncbi:MAG: TlpA family protein disulfide reductase [Ferruginibacter sp.]
MKVKLLLNLSLLFVTLNLSAQELTLNLSQYANKQAFIVAVHGVRKDTLGSILLDKNGKGELSYKNKQALAGLVNLTIKDKGLLSFDFVLSPNENPILSCDGEFVHSLNATIQNSPENDCLNRWFDAVVRYKQKISVNQEMSKLYDPRMPFFKLLETEKQLVEKQLQILTDTLNYSPLFAARYIQFKLTQEEKLAKVWESNEQRTMAQKYFTQIDFEALYGSSMWFAIINACIEAYAIEGPYYQTFGRDVVENLKRVKDLQVYEDLIDAAISVTEKFSWNKDQEAIVAFIVKDNRIKKPEGKLEKVIQSFTLSNGKKAPDLVITNPFGEINKTKTIKAAKLNSKYSLLLFYQSGCGHCETLIEELKPKYKDMVYKGIKIISIAGDTDQDTFTKTASSFPWSDKYRDVKGMNGINFKNYGVIGTPTMYLLDNKGIIIQKIANLAELQEWMKTY